MSDNKGLVKILLIHPIKYCIGKINQLNKTIGLNFNTFPYMKVFTRYSNLNLRTELYKPEMTMFMKRDIGT